MKTQPVPCYTDKTLLLYALSALRFMHDEMFAKHLEMKHVRVEKAHSVH